MHIGSQIMSLQPFEQAFARMAKLISELRQDGHVISTVDLGGGLGVDYGSSKNGAPTAESYAKLVKHSFGHLDCRIILEPGRSLVANSGILVGKVIYIKEGVDSTFLIVDAAMNDFLRPSMYSAHHEIVSEYEQRDPTVCYDVVGPVCETGDTFARQRRLPIQKAGQLIAIEGAGAYGSVMASTYNTRPLVPEILVDGHEYRVIRRRPDYDNMIGLDLPWDAGVTGC